MKFITWCKTSGLFFSHSRNIMKNHGQAHWYVGNFPKQPDVIWISETKPKESKHELIYIIGYNFIFNNSVTYAGQACLHPNTEPGFIVRPYGKFQKRVCWRYVDWNELCWASVRCWCFLLSFKQHPQFHWSFSFYLWKENPQRLTVFFLSDFNVNHLCKNYGTQPCIDAVTLVGSVFADKHSHKNCPGWSSLFTWSFDASDTCSSFYFCVLSYDISDHLQTYVSRIWKRQNLQRNWTN